jgi:hypothetical protein
MANFTQLRDLYAFPGFVPHTLIHGVFGDPFAAVIPLRRFRKKRPAERVTPSITPSTIKPFARSAISTAADDASTWSSPSAASRVGGAVP